MHKSWEDLPVCFGMSGGKTPTSLRKLLRDVGCKKVEKEKILIFDCCGYDTSQNVA